LSILQRLESSEIFGIKFGLENIRAILNELGNPQNSFQSVLIAGTNGKGSVAAMLAAAFIKHSSKTGLYTSPHLVSVRERLRVQDESIAESAFENVLQEVFAVSDRVLQHPATYFEVLTAAAMLHFKNEGVQHGVIEVGMGGRYDATNSLNQSLSIITSIDFDHQQYLGNTLAAIAGEKAAISKPGVPMITGLLPVEALDVVRNVCDSTHSDLETLEPTNIVEEKLVEGHGEFLYAPWNRIVRLNLMGRHQIQNAAIVLMAADALGLDQDETLAALREAKWPGRLEIVPDIAPPLLLDCAHNPMGAQSLVRFLEDINWPQVILLFTAMRDKNIPEMLRAFGAKANSIVLTQVEPIQRCASGSELLAAAQSSGIDSVFIPDFEEALRRATNLSQSMGLPVVVFGSIYLIGTYLSRKGA